MIKRLLVPVTEEQIEAARRYLESQGRSSSERHLSKLMGEWAAEGIQESAETVTGETSLAAFAEAMGEK